MADSVALENMMSSQGAEDVDSSEESSGETMEATSAFTATSSSTTATSERMETMHSTRTVRSVETYESDEAEDTYEAYEAYQASETHRSYEASETRETYESSETHEAYETSETREAYETSETREVADQTENPETAETTHSFQSSERTEAAETTDQNGTLESSSSVQVQSSSTTVSSSAEKKKRKSTKKSKKSSSSKSSKTSAAVQQYTEMPRLEHRNSKIHVRSVDAGQVQKKFNKVASENDAGASQLCKLCNKQVFQMERIKAERAVWHKNCFACSEAECGKKLTVDTYNSHEGKLYCKPHFKQLFQPKAVPDIDEPVFFKPELIIRESQPAQLPDDVVRANESSAGYGVEELSNLDLKSRFSLFERGGKSGDDQPLRDPETGRVVKRSDSILSRLMRFDADAAQRASQHLDLIDSSEEEGDPYDMDMVGNRRSLIRGDDSVSFGSISSIKSRWEDETAKAPLSRREELARQRKEELQVLRARQCHGRQLRLKEAYEQAVQESRDKDGHGVDLNYDPDKVRNLKQVFERSNSENNAENGSGYKDDFHGHLDPEKIRQMKQVFENGGSESSRSGHSERQEELSIIARESAKDARNLFKQMEESGFQEHSKRESFYGLENKDTFKTTSAMLNLFRRLESQQDYHSSSHHSDEEDGDEDDDEEGSDGSGCESDEADGDDQEAGRNGYGRRSSQQEELLQIAKERALARNLRDKFERWEFNDEDEKQMYERSNLMSMAPEHAEEIQASLNTARNLRAHFENLQKEAPVQTSRPRFKVNRFV